MEDEVGVGAATGDDAEERAQLVAIGQIIRDSRRDRFSVKELSRISGVSAGLISQIERGVGNPSITTLTRIAYALGLSIGSFFGQDAPTHGEPYQLVTATNRRKLIMPGHSLEYELLCPNLQGALGMVRTVVHAGFDNRSRPFEHKGEEIVHMLSGRLSIRIGDDELVLRPGDSISYDCSIPHSYFNDSGEPAEVIAAMSPPTF